MAPRDSKLTPTRTVLAAAICLMVGLMACPNTPWDRTDAVAELKRMHVRKPIAEISRAPEKQAESHSDDARRVAQPQR